jgi:Flp pilus assembly protein TadG
MNRLLLRYAKTKSGKAPKTTRSMLHTRVRAFRRNQTGAALVILAASLVPAIGATGLAVDGFIAYLVDDRLQGAVDAAALSTGAVVNGSGQNFEAQQIVEINFPSGYLGATLGSVEVSYANNFTRISIEATATAPTYFAKILGTDSVEVNARAVVERTIPAVEMALVMDNTGSMRSSNKIGAMKQAARDLIDILKPEGSLNDDVWIGLVPYTATVNIGPQHADWLHPNDRVHVSKIDFLTSSWKGCVEARKLGGDESDLTPAEAPFIAYYYGSDVDNRWWPPTGTIDERNSAENNGRGPNLGCGPPITFLTSDRDEILLGIDKMLPWHRGGTLGNLGLSWGWRMLSPRWRGVWDNDPASARPVDYNDPAIDKIAIVMTDGQNQLYDWPDHGPNNGVGPLGSDFSAYGRLQTFGFPSLDAARREVDSRFARTCQTMKANGIQIYTMTFGATPDQDTQALYRHCASNSDNYFHAPSNDDLIEAFHTIGRRLVTQRIVE